MKFFKKLINKFLFKTISKEERIKPEHLKKIHESMEEFWNDVYHNVDKHAAKYLENKNISIENYKETDFIKYVHKIIDQELERIYQSNETRKAADAQNIKINVIFLTMFGYATTIDITGSTALFSILFFMALYICDHWYKDIKACYMQNISSFSIIRELQNRYLPLKPHGDADAKLVQLIQKGKTHTPGMVSSMRKARFFGFLYFLIFFFYLITKHIL